MYQNYFCLQRNEVQLPENEPEINSGPIFADRYKVDANELVGLVRLLV